VEKIRSELEGEVRESIQQVFGALWVKDGTLIPRPKAPPRYQILIVETMGLCSRELWLINQNDFVAKIPLNVGMTIQLVLGSSFSFSSFLPI
jgi:hypothetical protein